MPNTRPSKQRPRLSSIRNLDEYIYPDIDLNSLDPEHGSKLIWGRLKTVANMEGHLRMVELFREIDKNRNGFVDMDEFREAITSVNIINADDKHLRHVMKMVKPEGKGVEFEYKDALHMLKGAVDEEAQANAQAQASSSSAAASPRVKKRPNRSQESTQESGGDYTPPMSAKLAMEFTGTFFLCLTVGLSAALSTLAPVAIGGILMSFVYAGAHVSGANYNPAVSVALALRGALPWYDALLYVAVQLLASVCAGCAALLVLLKEVQKPEEDGGVGVKFLGHPSVNEERFTLLAAFAAEAAYTFALCFVVLNVATAKLNAGNQFFGLAIGFTVVAGACSGGPVSGGAFNPAVGFGLPLCAGEFKFIPVYLGGPLAGAGIAAGFFYLTNMQEFKKD